MSRFGPLAALAAIAAYGVLSHGLMVNATASPWAALIILGPLVLGLVAMAAARRDGVTVLGCGAALALIAAALLLGDVRDVMHLYLLQYLALQLMMGSVFAVTLRRGSVPLVTRMATLVHREMTPAITAYTRQVTRAWVAYFGVMAVLAVVLFAAAPWSWWSVFANLVTPVAIVAMFAGEQLLRRWLHPEFERVSMAQVWNAWHRTTAVEAGSETPRAPGR